jgi:hypothetical protein
VISGVSRDQSSLCAATLDLENKGSAGTVTTLASA